MRLVIIDLPWTITFLPLSMACSMTLMVRSIWVENAERMTLPLVSLIIFPIVSTTRFSGREKPGLSALVESAIVRRTFFFLIAANSLISSGPTTPSSWVSFRSPVNTTAPMGVSTTIPIASGMVWVTEKKVRVKLSPSFSTELFSTSWYLMASLFSNSFCLFLMSAMLSLREKTGGLPILFRTTDMPPMWSRWAWEMMSPFICSLRSSRYWTLGTMKSMPGVSFWANFIPQSRRTISSSYSMPYRFLPISPTPPKNRTRIAPSSFCGMLRVDSASKPVVSSREPMSPPWRRIGF